MNKRGETKLQDPQKRIPRGGVERKVISWENAKRRIWKNSGDIADIFKKN